ncbi:MULTISPECIES: hemin uptake protein HemP [Alphaproteobacteria]|uniref:Hemin uptake protein HemP n=2 Tax=Alphaproteobacteria TaxID=28211 RepID=A0ABQ5U2Q3_9PROT|nr:hypothetical protein GCM10007924_00020 [Sneathiella chinensis]GLS02855.1 hypothetical protein GCM10007859_29040 [Brevundimonas denitrificans]
MAGQDKTSAPQTWHIPVTNAGIDSEALFKSGKELKIRHHGDEYTLRLTGNDKLILTK